jgi:hypothetical protein
MSNKLGPCPDCAAPIGEPHRPGCDIERCPHCGWTALGVCTSTRTIPGGNYGRASGGEGDCERLGFFVNEDRNFPDLNRLFTDCVWDAETQRRWERRQ